MFILIISLPSSDIILIFFLFFVSILAIVMALLSQGTLQRFNTVVSIFKTSFHVGLIPLILYLGFNHGAEPGMPDLTLASLLWA